MNIVALLLLAGVCLLGGYLFGHMRGWSKGYYHAWNTTATIRMYGAKAMIRDGWVRQRGQPALIGTDVYDEHLKAHVLRPELRGVGGDAVNKWLREQGHEAPK